MLLLRTCMDGDKSMELPGLAGSFVVVCTTKCPCHMAPLLLLLKEKGNGSLLGQLLSLCIALMNYACMHDEGQI